MRAAVLHDFKQPLSVEQVERPAPAPDEVLIKVEACGVCHSDLHIAEGDWPQMLKIIKRPLIPGHEVVGRVVEKGESVSELDVGDRVGVAWIHWTCGECELCKEGLENLCPAQQITGATVDGGFAEFIKAKATHALKVPDGLTPEEAAPLFCAGVTTYRAIKNAQVTRGQRVAVFGVGGLGHLAVQIARSFGAEVIAADISDEKLELARSLGAGRVVNVTAPDAVKQFRALGGAHAAIVTSAAKAAYDMAFNSLRPGGTLVVVGLPAEPLTFPAILMVGRETRVVSSAVGTREDLRGVLGLAAAGDLRCHLEARPLDEINEIFDRMRGAQLAGRIVLKL
jgi:propanol-preferring alcohol dehydrogenase